jgi:hypothetical protein
MVFEARIRGVKVTPPKRDNNWQGSTGGGLEVTLQVEYPNRPTKPSPPYEFSSGARSQEWKKRPTDKETAERYDKAKLAYEVAMEKWEVAMRQHGERLRSYGALVGLSAIFADEVMSVQLFPANQDMLPGFGVELLAPQEQEEGDNDE